MTVPLHAPDPHCCWRLTARPFGIRHWRQAVVDVLAEWGAPRSSLELAYFGVSELLGNVSRHVPQRCCRLEVTRKGTAAVVSVFDRSTQLPKVNEPDWDAESGRGLWLLREMADGGAGFGFHHVEPPWAKVVWFRCDIRVPT